MEVLTKPRTTTKEAPQTKDIFPNWWWIVILIVVAMSSLFDDFVKNVSFV